MDRPIAAAGRRELENHRELSVHVRQQQHSNPELFFCENPPAASYPSIPDSLQQQQLQNGVDLKLVQGCSSPFFSSETSTAELLEAKLQLPVKLFGVPLQHSNNNNNNKALEQPTSTSTTSTTATISSVRHGLHASEVVLAGSKRRQPEPWDVVSEQQQQHPHDRVFLRPPPRKCLQGSSEMGSETVSAVQAPWLQICATRDEGVYI